MISGERGATPTPSAARAPCAAVFCRNAWLCSRARGSDAALLPLLAGRRSTDGRAKAYVCRNHTCEAPVEDAASARARVACSAALDDSRSTTSARSGWRAERTLCIIELEVVAQSSLHRLPTTESIRSERARAAGMCAEQGRLCSRREGRGAACWKAVVLDRADCCSRRLRGEPPSLRRAARRRRSARDPRSDHRLARRRPALVGRVHRPVRPDSRGRESAA